jgi:hypothetical protein
MKEVGTRKQVLCKKAVKTKKGETYESLISSDKKYASTAKRSESSLNSPWRAHVLAFSKKKGISYANAISDPNCKSSYKRTPVVKKTKENK